MWVITPAPVYFWVITPAPDIMWVITPPPVFCWVITPAPVFCELSHQLPFLCALSTQLQFLCKLSHQLTFLCTLSHLLPFLGCILLICLTYSWFHKKDTWSVHLFNGDYLSIPKCRGSYGYLFHEIPSMYMYVEHPIAFGLTIKGYPLSTHINEKNPQLSHLPLSPQKKEVFILELW